MFAKSEWFSRCSCSCGVRPSAWQGWLLAGGYALAAAAPTALLAFRGQHWESLIWLAFSAALIHRERGVIRRGLNPEATPSAGDETFVIDEQTDVTKIATRNYDLEVKS